MQICIYIIVNIYSIRCTDTINAATFIMLMNSSLGGCTQATSILLQGHKIKNAKTQLAQRLREVPVGIALIISGTPVQNNLMELHALFDFVNPVSLIPHYIPSLHLFQELEPRVVYSTECIRYDSCCLDLLCIRHGEWLADLQGLLGDVRWFKMEYEKKITAGVLFHLHRPAPWASQQQIQAHTARYIRAAVLKPDAKPAKAGNRQVLAEMSDLLPRL